MSARVLLNSGVGSAGLSSRQRENVREGRIRCRTVGIGFWIHPKGEEPQAFHFLRNNAPMKFAGISCLRGTFASRRSRDQSGSLRGRAVRGCLWNEYRKSFQGVMKRWGFGGPACISWCVRNPIEVPDPIGG